MPKFTFFSQSIYSVENIESQQTNQGSLHFYEHMIQTIYKSKKQVKSVGYDDTL